MQPKVGQIWKYRSCDENLFLITNVSSYQQMVWFDRIKQNDSGWMYISMFIREYELVSG